MEKTYFAQIVLIEDSGPDYWAKASTLGEVVDKLMKLAKDTWPKYGYEFSDKEYRIEIWDISGKSDVSNSTGYVIVGDDRIEPIATMNGRFDG